MVKCTDCENFQVCEQTFRMSGYSIYDMESNCVRFRKKAQNTKPMTNADRIRAMSDRELADFLSGKFSEVCCEEHNLSVIQLEAMKHNLFCVFMKWLKQPADEVQEDG